VLISPGRVGSDSFVLQLMNGDASPLATKEATLSLSLPARGIEPIERNAALGPDGYWHVRNVPLPFPRPLAHADRCFDHRFPEDHAGG
jgi:copper transport protein